MSHKEAVISAMARVQETHAASKARQMPPGQVCTDCKGRGWCLIDSGAHGLCIQKCDACARYADDEQAGEAARTALDPIIERIGIECPICGVPAGDGHLSTCDARVPTPRAPAPLTLPGLIAKYTALEAQGFAADHIPPGEILAELRALADADAEEDGYEEKDAGYPDEPAERLLCARCGSDTHMAGAVACRFTPQ